MSDYRPISCAGHSELELQIMRRRRLRIRWSGEGGLHQERLLPVDIGAERGAEYLYVERADGERFRIRLDAIVDFEPADSLRDA